jgi:hypothetical protein
MTSWFCYFRYFWQFFDMLSQILFLQVSLTEVTCMKFLTCCHRLCFFRYFWQKSLVWSFLTCCHRFCFFRYFWQKSLVWSFLTCCHRFRFFRYFDRSHLYEFFWHVVTDFVSSGIFDRSHLYEVFWQVVTDFVSSGIFDRSHLYEVFWHVVKDFASSGIFDRKFFDMLSQIWFLQVFLTENWYFNCGRCWFLENYRHTTDFRFVQNGQREAPSYTIQVSLGSLDRQGECIITMTSWFSIPFQKHTSNIWLFFPL